MTYSQCAPFDESPIRKSGDYRQISEKLRAERRLLSRRIPETMADIDAYLDTYLEMVELECRHCFAEGYRLGKQGLT